MGIYNDFDLDIKKVKEDDAKPMMIDFGKEAGDYNRANTDSYSCGWLTTSCSAHCR